MNFYIQLNTDKGTRMVHIDNVELENLEKAVADYFVENYTWMQLESWQVISRKDGCYTTYPAELKQPQPLRIIARKETYSNHVNPVTKKLDLINVAPAKFL